MGDEFADGHLEPHEAVLRSRATLCDAVQNSDAFQHELPTACLASLIRARMIVTQSQLLQNFVRRQPNGDTHERDVCSTCGFVNYQNPKIVVGSVVRHESKILMCRRAIAPSKGKWTLPAGYMEIGETVEEAARREAMEEACADIRINSILAIYSLAHIAQVQIMHLATLDQPKFAAGEESLEVDLFDWDALPLDDLAFPSVLWALEHSQMALNGCPNLPFTEPPNRA